VRLALSAFARFTTSWSAFIFALLLAALPDRFFAVLGLLDLVVMGIEAPTPQVPERDHVAPILVRIGFGLVSPE
jgi:hypothetical protein